MQNLLKELAPAVAAQLLRHLPQIADAMKERVRQDNKFGPQDRPPVEWFLILSEEVGEVAKECVEIQFNDAAHPYANLANYRKELVETVAVGLAALLNFDTRAEREDLRRSLPNSLTIADCSACRGRHSGLEVWARESEPYVICPASNTRVFITKNEVHAGRMEMADALHSEPTPPVVVMRGQTPGPTEGIHAGNSIQNALDSFAGVTTGRKNRQEGGPSNLIAGLSEQVERVGKLVELYESTPNGNVAAAFMKADLEKARAALQSGDIADMVAVYKDLQGYSE